MRKQTKIAAVVSAAALLALGASITSFAASKGTWMMVDGEWYCYNSSGDVYENTFCTSNGKDYYVGDDGQLVRSDWVEYDGDYYFVNSSGQKITNDWRLAVPADDSDEEEQWYYFKSNGKRAEDEKLLIAGKTYFFDSEGQMLTGWVQESGDGWDEGSTDDVKSTATYYCDDETGARLEKAWIYTYAPSVDPDDVGSDDDEHWYYLKSSGKVATGKQTNIKGQNYFFDNEGIMLTGWVTKTASNGYTEIWENDDDGDGYYDVPLGEYAGGTVHFCDEEDGHMKKNKWIKVWNNIEFGAEDDDNDKYWFYINSSGSVYIPEAGEYDYVGHIYDLNDGEGEDFGDRFGAEDYAVDSNYSEGGLVYATEKKINSKTYLFNSHGQMIYNFFRTAEDAVSADGTKDVKANSMFYFGGEDDGARKTGSVSVKDDSGASYRCYFASSTNKTQHYYNAVGINGAKSGKLYADSLLIKALDSKYEIKTVTIDGVEYDFIVNKSGSIQSSAKEYEEDDDVLINAKDYKFCTDTGATYKSIVYPGESDTHGSDVESDSNASAN